MKVLKHMFDSGIIDTKEKHRIRKADLFFVLAVLAAALISFFILRLHSAKGGYAVVSYDGTTLMKVSLVQPEPRYFLFTYGEAIEVFSMEEWQDVNIPAAEYNVFLYQDGEISMIQSSCPDKICVRHRAISMTGENIICLPHKLVIEISADKERNIDGVAY